jgi:nucleoside diphosphate kinase
MVPIKGKAKCTICYLRSLVGNTDPALAAKGTLRELYGVSKTENVQRYWTFIVIIQNVTALFYVKFAISRSKTLTKPLGIMQLFA